MTHKEVQQIAKDTINYARNIIHSGMTLVELRTICENRMLESGADSFWYWNIGAFVFCGKETSLSFSGKNYITSNSIIKENDIITIDLSPQCGNIWGDYARTIIIQNGIPVDLANCTNQEWKNGLLMEEKLHSIMKNFVTTDTTFEQLFFYINDFITSNGYVNNDFSKNLGHSIAKDKNDRIYIEKRNNSKLSEVSYFTFEPHISIPESNYGLKLENIYYFKNNKITEL